MLLAALPILVELFTSEGCSSCPPADAVIARLHAEQPVPGVQLLVLSEHVDYWNNLGWRDPFSSAQFTERQSDYGPRMYTPQAIVDGRTDVLGSDEAGIEKAATAAMADPHGTVRFVQNARSVQIVLAGLPPHGPAQVWLAILEDGLVSKVERGENAGRTLPHTAVVRSLTKLATLPKEKTAWQGEAEIPQGRRAIVFVQEPGKRVLAAGTP